MTTKKCTAKQKPVRKVRKVVRKTTNKDLKTAEKSTVKKKTNYQKALKMATKIS